MITKINVGGNIVGINDNVNPIYMLIRFAKQMMCASHFTLSRQLHILFNWYYIYYSGKNIAFVISAIKGDVNGG